MPKPEEPRVGEDDLVHDDHTREVIIDAEQVAPRVWIVRVAERERGTHVCRLPALDKNGRRAWTPDLDAVKKAIS